MSLKGGMSNKELRITVADAQKGKNDAVNKLSEYAEKGLISAEFYKKMSVEYRIKKARKKRSNGIKSVLVAIILLFSMLCGLLYLIDQYGKGAGVWYIFSWVWAIFYAFPN